MNYLRSLERKKKNKVPTTQRKKNIPVYSPDSPALLRNPSYDDNLVAYERNVEALQEEEANLSPKKEVVMDLMKKTFFIRRKNVLIGQTSVVSLLQIFPSLKNHSQVSVHSRV